MRAQAAPARLAAARSRRRPASLWLGAVMVGAVVLAALLSLLWLPQDPLALDFGAQLAAPSTTYPLGTDHFGRDLLSRSLVGARSALAVGALAVGAALLLGGGLGALAGWRGGWADEVVMRLVDVLYAFPAILLALLLATVHRPGTLTATLAIALATVPTFARLSRAAVLSTKALAFVEAGRALGQPEGRLLRRHVLPAAAPVLLVQASLSFAIAVLAEAALSYLGLGSPPDLPSWGNMLREAQGFMAFSPYPALVPGLAIVWTVLGLSLLGDGLRDALDPTARA